MEIDDYIEDSQDSTQNTRAVNLAAKNLVRLAFFTEQKRIPLSRQEIQKKCALPPRSFNKVIEIANKELESKFGMQLCQLAARERKRANLNAGSLTQTEEKMSNNYILKYMH